MQTVFRKHTTDCVLFFVSTLEEKGIFMLGMGFFIHSIFAHRKNSFDKYSIEDIDFIVQI